MENPDDIMRAVQEVLQYWHCPSQFEKSSDYTNPKIDRTGNPIRDFH